MEAFGKGRGWYWSEIRRGQIQEYQGLAGYPLEATYDQAVFPVGLPV
jgi:hypothetical protein